MAETFVYGVHLALHIVRELYGAHFFSALIQQHHHLARRSVVLQQGESG